MFKWTVDDGYKAVIKIRNEKKKIRIKVLCLGIEMEII